MFMCKEDAEFADDVGGFVCDVNEIENAVGRPEMGPQIVGPTFFRQGAALHGAQSNRSGQAVATAGILHKEYQNIGRRIQID